MRFVFVSLAVFFSVAALTSVYAFPAAVCRWLNRGRRRFSSSAISAGPTAVVVLSGRVEFVPSPVPVPEPGAPELKLGPTSRAIRAVLSPSCEARVHEAVRVYELVAPDWVISTGGIPNPPCAELMKTRLIQLGVPAARVLLENRSKTTRDEAVLVARMLKGLGVRQSVIVTSDVHMPRSLASFRAVGINPVPAGAADPGLSQPNPMLPSMKGLRFSLELLHELIGLAWYRLRGWQA